MNAMEKVAWTEVAVSAGALVVAVLLIPVLGRGATAGFGLLGLLGLTFLFVRGRGGRVVVDERDREIEMRATRVGLVAAWMAVLVPLVVVTIWADYARVDVVSTRLLSWLIWVPFALCFGVRGLVAVILYRRLGRAA